ncbi:RNA polymerase ECF family sigma subunit [Herbihabitans rhizosphaerae]|uniref:RNA polymerase ECF family sigma subunit n=1 Tax=Herbihabitans rhizosphaerae TaxID=1872711 RepID=A0A4Q7L061_9PSEU|nr:sigma-70 family RNA polymerase sigma factor [Herbihabitans rhizosphaerae]RZS41392.1 RNA polymerase ECF family sigma subunit [Herbihabitans rhizosphaerae]
MDDQWLARRFEEHRGHLRAVAYRMLGSTAEAEDAVQEAWLRLSRAGAADVRSLGAWLTTVIGRVCLDMLRTKRSRREEPLGEHDPEDRADPEREAVLADSVGIALLIVLDTLTPAERLAFVLHDTFGVPFEQIATIVDRSPNAAKMLASRARRRVREAAEIPLTDSGRRRALVEAFLAATRDGEFEALLAVLAPDAVVRADSLVIRGAEAVARQALTFMTRASAARTAMVDGAPGIVVEPQGTPVIALLFTIAGDKIAHIDVCADPDRLRTLEIA